MKKYITLLVLICVSSSYAQLNNIINKTPAELAKIVDGQTDSDAAYWESHAYLYIQNIVDRLQADFLQANDYATLSAAISAASTDTLSVMVSSRYNITTNTTLSGQTAIIARQGARFNVSSGDTLTINIPFYAGDYQVFEGSGVVRGLKLYKPEWFGAKVNDGIDDSGSINSAITSLNSTGGVVVLSDGEWTINTAINTSNNLSLIGSGRSTMLKASSGNISIIHVSTDTNVTISNITFDGVDSTNVDGVSSDNSKNITITRNHFKNIGSYAVSLINTTKSWVTFNLSEQANDDHQDAAEIRLLRGCNDNVIGWNKLMGADSVGIFIQENFNGSFPTPKNNLIVGNEIRNNEKYGIMLYSVINPSSAESDSSLKRNKIINNTIGQIGYMGIYLLNNSYTLVQGNSLDSTFTNDPGNETLPRSAISINKGFYIKIYDNVITNTINAYHGIRAAGTIGIDIQRNDIFNSANTGIFVSNNAENPPDNPHNTQIIGNRIFSPTNSGIRLVGFSQSNPALDAIIANNTVTGSATQGILLNSMKSAIVQGNRISYCNSRGIDADSVSNSIFIANILSNNDTSNVGQESIHFNKQCDRNLITNNIFYNDDPLKGSRGAFRFNASDDSFNVAKGNIIWNMRLEKFTDNGALSEIKDNIYASAQSQGSNSFVATATTDTVTVSGLEATGVVNAWATGTSINANDVLSVQTRTGEFVVHRPAAGTSGLPYSFEVIKWR